MHPRSIQSALAAVRTIGPIELGFVYPPKPGEARGRGSWIKGALGPCEIEPLLPRAAAANARGAAVYMRPSPNSDGSRRGIVLLDDVDRAKVGRMLQDGFEPRLVVETSPGNLQAWVFLPAETLAPGVAHEAARRLAAKYEADPRAVAASQPGRLPGFTNRKERHRRPDGLFPYVQIHALHETRVASRGDDLIKEILAGGVAPQAAQAARAPRAPEKTVQVGDIDDEVAQRLDAIYAAESARIDREVQAGSRPATAASASERDFALAVAALGAEISENEVASWLARRRPEKAGGYAERTLAAAKGRLASASVRRL